MTEEDWSAPEAAVLASIGDALDAGRRAVLATIVGVEGSAYRRPGAKMLIAEDGDGLGHITAGCLEGEVIELAESVLERGEPRVETYDLTGEDDVWGLGIGCNGVIDVLLEPLSEAHRPIAAAHAAGEPIVAATVLDGDAPAGAKAHYRDGSVELGDGFPERFADPVARTAADALAEDASDTVGLEVDGDRIEVFADAVRPAPRLLVAGSGHDAGPVVDLGRANGFRVTVAGFRGAADLESRFPAADRTVATSPARLVEAVDPDERTYAVLMTHNFVDDRLALDELLGTPVPYVGLMGPRKRFEEMREEFAAEGRTFSAAELERVYTPVGLDLGAGSPHAIATSIVAEVMAVANDREPRHLKDREGPIHDRTRVGAPSPSG